MILGIIPPDQCAVGDLLHQLDGRDVTDQRRRIVDVVQQTGHIGEIDDLLRAELGGDGTRGGVGVDVVRLTRRKVGADGRHDRDQILCEQPVDDLGVDLLDVAHEAERGVADLGLDQPAVLARQPDGERPVGVDGRHDLAVHLADQDHGGDLECLGVGDPEPVEELGFLAETLHHVADLRAASMDDHRSDAERVQQHDVVGERLHEGVVDHGVAAELHHDRRTAERSDVGQRLDEHLDGEARLATHEVPMFSST